MPAPTTITFFGTLGEAGAALPAKAAPAIFRISRRFTLAVYFIPAGVSSTFFRSERLLERRRKQAAFRDPNKMLDNFDFTFNPKMNRSLVFDLATCAFIGKREDAASDNTKNRRLE
jgi:hypothetical protein